MAKQLIRCGYHFGWCVGSVENGCIRWGPHPLRDGVFECIFVFNSCEKLTISDMPTFPLLAESFRISCVFSAIPRGICEIPLFFICVPLIHL